MGKSRPNGGKLTAWEILVHLGTLNIPETLALVMERHDPHHDGWSSVLAHEAFGSGLPGLGMWIRHVEFVSFCGSCLEEFAAFTCVDKD